jgi:hypothetical protein
LMLPAIDWTAHWFDPWRAISQQVANEVAAGAAVPTALDSHGSGNPHFVPAETLPPGMPYERYIFETGNCPTRDNPHDFFNGLAWLEMPRSKRQLNRLQAAQIAAHGVGAERGPVRDAATLFDENGAVLSAPEPLWQALSQRDWQRLFVELRPLWAQARLLVFGHALLEKLVVPRKNLAAHVWAESAPCACAAEVDAWLAAQLTAERLAAKPFLPLPVLGVPGWCAENGNFSFYDDPLVFRPAKREELT